MTSENLTCSVSNFTSAWTRYLLPNLGSSLPIWYWATRSDTIWIGETTPSRFHLNVRFDGCFFARRSSSAWYSAAVKLFMPFTFPLFNEYSMSVSWNGGGPARITEEVYVPGYHLVQVSICVESDLAQWRYPGIVFCGFDFPCFEDPAKRPIPRYSAQVDSWDCVIPCKVKHANITRRWGELGPNGIRM